MYCAVYCPPVNFRKSIHEYAVVIEGRCENKPMKLLICLTLVSIFCLCGCQKPVDDIDSNTAGMRIAFMPDIHFHDVYGEFADGAYVGLPTNTTQGVQSASIRSMRAQLNSTRLFNENYFALYAALDDIVKRKIKYVALPGDFSDDGQPLHLRGLKKILDQYRREHGIEFFMAPGNHDPTRPVSHAGGKPDFLGRGGKEQPIYSLQHPFCLGKNTPVAQDKGIICSDEVQELGYAPIMNLFREHGFFPRADYIYYETPYSKALAPTASKKYVYEFLAAQEQARFENRHYEICHQGAGGKYKQPDYSDCYSVADTSYLVEPVAGLWLLAIDANVYQPKLGGNGNVLDAENFLSSSDAGYNKMLTHKTHLLEWIHDLVQRAQSQGKTLIAFSHFPMTEFYDGASEDVARLMGNNKLQLSRNPSDHTSKILADRGLKVHVAGHMHINDTGVYRGHNNQVLFNIQAPSLAAYVPAYKLLTIHSAQQIEVETILLDHVPRFNELFAHYQAEWDYLRKMNMPGIWDKNILQAKNYQQFTQSHLRELVRLRFLPQEWPVDLRELLLQITGEQLLTMAQLPAEISLEQIKTLLRDPQQGGKIEKQWQNASQQAAEIILRHGLSRESFAAWSGLDMSVDFYRLLNADQLALQHMSAQRIAHYRLLAQEFSAVANAGAPNMASSNPVPSRTVPSRTESLKTESLKAKNSHAAHHNGDVKHENLREHYQTRLAQLLQILVQFSEGAPSNHFLLELDSGQIHALP